MVFGGWGDVLWWGVFGFVCEGFEMIFVLYFDVKDGEYNFKWFEERIVLYWFY